MQTQVTFRGCPPSEAIVEEVQRQAIKINHLVPRVTACHVVFEAQSSTRTGTPSCRVSVHLFGGGHRGAIHSSAGRAHFARQHPLVREAFSAVRRQLSEPTPRQRAAGN